MKYLRLAFHIYLPIAISSQYKYVCFLSFLCPDHQERDASHRQPQRLGRAAEHPRVGLPVRQRHHHQDQRPRGRRGPGDLRQDLEVSLHHGAQTQPHLRGRRALGARVRPPPVQIVRQVRYDTLNIRVKLRDLGIYLSTWMSFLM